MKLKSNKFCTFIFARKGSVGIKNKNLKKIKGKSLVEITLSTAKKVFNQKNIYISTDCEKIKKIALKYKVNIINRPKKLATSNAKEWDAWRHAINEVSKSKKFDNFISLPVVSPLRSYVDIKNGIKLFEKSKNIDGVIGINKAKKNPWFNMVTISSNLIRLASYSRQKFYNRQQAPNVYEINTVIYIFKKKFIIKKNHIFDGRIKGIEIPFPRCIDIDDKFDLKTAKYFY